MEYSVDLSSSKDGEHATLKVVLTRGKGPPHLVVYTKKKQYSVDAEDMYVGLVGDRNCVEIPVVCIDTEIESARAPRRGMGIDGNQIPGGDGDFFHSHQADDVTIRIHGHPLRSLREQVLKHLPRPTSVSPIEIAPSSFYGERKVCDTKKKLKYFHRQDDAFLYFDTLKAKDRSNLKIYSFEKHVSGQRGFFVADNNNFFKEYIMSDLSSRHVYESIRDGFPCRLYFDLEYAKVTNMDADGDAMTEEWIKLVAWKVHQLWGFALEARDFVVFDSCTADKFSKHVIVLIPNDPAISHGLQAPGEPKECLFLNNGQVKHFVDALVGDITYEGEDDVPDARAEGFDPEGSGEGYTHTSQSVGVLPTSRTKRTVSKPRPGYEHFWVNKKEGLGQCFFVDTGVYSRNRVFRLYGSCKRSDNAKKTKPSLRLSRADTEKYGPFTDNSPAALGPTKFATGFNAFNSSIDTTNTSRRLSNDRSSSEHGGIELAFTDSKSEREHLYARNLSLGAVVPEDLFVNAPQPPFVVHLQQVRSTSHIATGTTTTTATGIETQASAGNSSYSPRGTKKRARNTSSPQSSSSSPEQHTTDVDSSLSHLENVENAGSEFASVNKREYGKSKPADSTTLACDPLSFNTKYLCLLLPQGPGGLALVGELPQNWICRQLRAHELYPTTTPATLNDFNPGDVRVHDETFLRQPFYNIDNSGNFLLGNYLYPDGEALCTGNIGDVGSLGLLGACNDPIKWGLSNQSRGTSKNLFEKGFTAVNSHDNYQRSRQDGELCTGGQTTPSPFPKVDMFVLNYISSPRRGGDGVQPAGYIAKWVLSGKMGHGDASHQIYVKIRYHIGGGYRYCAKVCRHHKSNGIMIDVTLNEHLATRALTQLCWDPDCREFKSKAEPVPYAVLPQAYELDGYKEVIYDRQALKLIQDLHE